MKLEPMTYKTARSTDPSVPLMTVVNEVKQDKSRLREYLTRVFNLSDAVMEQLLSD